MSAELPTGEQLLKMLNEQFLNTRPIIDPIINQLMQLHVATDDDLNPVKAVGIDGTMITADMVVESCVVAANQGDPRPLLALALVGAYDAFRGYATWEEL